MKVRRLLPVALFFAASLRAQDFERVNNLAPDHMNVSPVEFNAALLSLTAGTAAQRGDRVPLNLMGNSGTSSFLVLSTANVAGQNGAFFKTELAIQTLWQSSQIKVNIFGVPNNTNPLTNPGAVVGGAFTLNGFTRYKWDNILDSLGLSGAGYLLVAIDSSIYNSTAYMMSAWANTYTAAPAGGFFRTPVPVFTDGSLFGYDNYRHSNVAQDIQNRNNIVVYNIDTSRSLTLDLRFHPYASSSWVNTFTVTLAPGESRQYAFSAIFPGVTGQGELAFNYQSGGSWLGYVVRTDNGTNDGLLELPYRCNVSSWPH